MNEELLRFKKDQKYLVFDFETCSLNLVSEENKPWQLAFMVYQGGQLIESNDYYIHWDTLNLSDGARKVTGFSDAKYKKNATDAALVLDHFERYLYDPEYIKLGHNILGFDIYIHNIYRKLLGRSTDHSYLNDCLDTLCLAKAIAKDIKIRKLIKEFTQLVKNIERGVGRRKLFPTPRLSSSKAKLGQLDK